MGPKKYVSPLNAIKEIEKDELVKSLIKSHLPDNYDFEIGKTVLRIRSIKDCKTVALQFPEGLLIFATSIGRVLSKLTSVDIIILGDITYGACCVDDYTSRLLNADLLVHYGHSCLVPTNTANLTPTIYVFVSIKINETQAADTIINLLSSDQRKIRVEGTLQSVSLVSTIQFAHALNSIKARLEGHATVVIPRIKPLSNGEILGCTAPIVNTDMIVYIGDGRFHLEAIMIANPLVPAFRYDPYNGKLTKEVYEMEELRSVRSSSLKRVQEGSRMGVIQGTLGRQGNHVCVNVVYKKVESNGMHPYVLLMSEITPCKLNLFKSLDSFVQFACPRLSIDWGASFDKPLLTSYEAMNLNNTDYNHPMDYYAYQSNGPHTPNHKIF